MAVTVKRAILWRREVDNQPGMLANTLHPLSEAGADLQVVMAYRYPGGENKAAIELHPVSGKKSVAAAQRAGSPRRPSPPCWSRATIDRGLATRSPKRSAMRGSM